MNLRDWRVFTPVIMAGYIIARFLLVALHEIVGHGLASVLAGGSFYGVYASPGPGFAYIFLPFGAPPSTHAAVLLSGVAIGFAVGTILFLLRKRIHDKFSRLLLLIFLKVLIFQTAVYMAIGALQDTSDTGAAAKHLDAPALAAALLVIGITIAVFMAYWISRNLLKLLAPEFSLKKWLYVLLLFWLFPPFVSLALGSGLEYSALYIALVIIMVHLLLLMIIWQNQRKVLEPAPVELESEVIATRDVLTFSIAFILVLATWLTAFGPTVDTAHGVLLMEPPIEAEMDWFGPLAINLHVQLSRTYNASDPVNITLEFKFRGLPELTSPLAREVWNTYDQRAYFPFYEAYSDQLAKDAFLTSGWNIASSEIFGEVWVGNQTHDYARRVHMTLDTTSRRQLINVTGGNLTLTINDPFKSPNVEQTYGFVDEVTVGWGGGMMLENYTQHGGSTAPDLVTGELRWQNWTFETAPEIYVVTIRLV